MTSEFVVCTLVEILCRNVDLNSDVLNFWRFGDFLSNKLVETTEDEVRVFPFTGPRVLGETMKLLDSWTVPSDGEPGSSVLVEWIAVVVTVLLSANRVLVSGDEMNVG